MLIYASFNDILFKMMDEMSFFFREVLFSSKWLLSWLVLNAFFAYYIRKLTLPYYDPKYVSETKEDGTTSTYNIHDKYPEFCRHDDYPSFFWMWVGFSTVLWIKVGLWITFLIIIYIDCR